MAKLNYENGVTSVILRVKILDTDSTAGAGKTGLTHSSSGLIISTIADNEASATAYTQAASNIETITTLGTFATPTASKCRFKEVDATNHPGLYEVQIADARWGVSNARSVIISLSGVSGAAQVDAEVQLKAVPANVTAVSDGLLTAAKFASDFFQTIWDKATSALTTPGSIGKFLVDNIGSLISAIAGGVTSTAPVDPTSLTFTIVRGDDYSDDSGRALPEWTSDGWTALDLTAATSVTFKAKTRYGTVVFTKAMDVLSDTQVRLQLTDAETAAFDVGVGAYSYDIESVLSVAKGSDIVTLAQGKMTVLSDVR